MKNCRNALVPFLIAIALAPVPAYPGDGPESKIAVMEKIFDTTLIESAHALVYQGGVAEGVYLDGYGVMIKIEFEFVEKPSLKLLDYLDDIDSLKIYWREMIGLGEEGDTPFSVRRREQLNRIEDELIETLIDYGKTLSTLGDDEVVSIVAFPWHEVWDVSPAPIRALTITARFGDLKKYGENKLSADKIRERIDIVEVPK